jgi:hypothetical protein
MSGVQAETTTDTGGGQDVGYIENGDWIAFSSVNFGSGASSLNVRVASQTSGGSIEAHLDSLTGTLVGTCSAPGTGGWQTWTTVSCSVSGATGTHALYLKFTGASGYLFNVNWFQFVAGGVQTLVDPLNDWSLTYSHTGNLTFDTGQLSYFENDSSRVDRSTQTTENFVYNVTGMKSVTVKLYYNDPSSNSNQINIYASSNNQTYTSQGTTQDTAVATGGSWYRVNWSVANLPANTNFLMIEIPANSKAAWTPQISQVTITH